jgi:hypothetical protein
MCVMAIAVMLMSVERHRKMNCSYTASWEGKVNHSAFSTAVAKYIVCQMSLRTSAKTKAT